MRLRRLAVSLGLLALTRRGRRVLRRSGELRVEIRWKDNDGFAGYSTLLRR